MKITVEVNRDPATPDEVYDAFAGWLTIHAQEFADMLELPAGAIVLTVRSITPEPEVPA